MANLSSAQSKFAFDLYKKLGEDNEDNLFISPFSISSAMSMVLLGAKCNTADELMQGLGFETRDQVEVHTTNASVHENLLNIGDHISLKIANKLFPEASYSVLDGFLTDATKFYKTDVETLDYKESANASRLHVNKWVEDKTNQKIKDLLAEGTVTSDTRLILANAVYFKGDWMDKFDTKATRSTEFHVSETKVTQVQMMSRKAKYLTNFDQKLDLQILQLPYKGEELSMVLLLPNQRFGLNEVEKQLTVEKLNELIKTSGKEELVLSLPKFKVEYQKDLVESLKLLGMKDVFDEKRANLAGISGVPDLVVSTVAHKAFLEVNEEGSEAAAATAPVMMLRMALLPPIEFKCDHPFMLLIRHNKSGAILFMGRISSL